MTFAERQEHAAMLELYRAALGMLDGTPLGESARKRLTKPSSEPEPEPDVFAPSAPVDIDAARTAGRDAAKAGVKVIENPFVSGDPRRAAWDEGWCAETGSDGMDIPDAWRRSKAKKAKKDDDGEDDK
jgi:hypothetical protein